MEKVNSVRLEGQAAAFVMDIYSNKWTRCYWVIGEESHFLGAEVLGHLVRKLLLILTQKDGAVVREIDGIQYTSGLALSEDHHTIYSTRLGEERVFYFEDKYAKPVGIFKISPAQSEAWVEALSELERNA